MNDFDRKCYKTNLMQFLCPVQWSITFILKSFFYQIPLTWSKYFSGSICNSSVVPSSWDDSETTDHSMITATSDSEDDLIKEFKKDLELSKNDDSDSDNSSNSSKISVIEQSGIYYKNIYTHIYV